MALHYPSDTTYFPASANPKPAGGRLSASVDASKRRTEILHAAASVIAVSGPRSSLHEIGDAAGIRAGSLYQHFESKDAILVELLCRYHSELDRIANVAQRGLASPEPHQARRAIAELSAAIANCAIAHRAAVQMSSYAAPSSNPEVVELALRRPVALQRAMLQTLRAARCSDLINPDIDLTLLADRMCQMMLNVGLDVIGRNNTADGEAATLCSIILDGLAHDPPSDAQLDQSAALRAANTVIRTWAERPSVDPMDKAAVIQTVARKEFGRKGYELTTVRDIAAAAGVATSTVCRLIGSKEHLLASIMHSFGASVGQGFVAVLRSEGLAVEKLDALSWVNIKALERFPDEWKIQLAWIRQSPPSAPNPGLTFKIRMRQLRTLLSEGIRSNQLRGVSPVGLLSRCVMDALWIPETIIRKAGARPAHIHARDTVLRGVVARNT